MKNGALHQHVAYRSNSDGCDGTERLVGKDDLERMVVKDKGSETIKGEERGKKAVASPPSHFDINNSSHSATPSWPPGFTPPKPAVGVVSQSNSSPEQIHAHIPTAPSSILAPNPPVAVEQVSSAVNSVQPDRISEEGFIGGRGSSVTPVVQAAESMGDSK
ncbi:hypothetical protein LXL04_009620 [Taraxacum kok-saghyz]